MTKKGMQNQVIIELVILVLTIGILIYVYSDSIQNVFKTFSEKEPCRQSVSLKALKVAGVKVADTSLKCPANSIYIKNKKELEKANKKIADEMYDCWDKFGSGEVDFLEDYEFGFSKRYCFICSKIVVNETISTKKLLGLGDYLTQNEIPLKDITYSSYLFPGVDDEAIKQIYKEISIEEPLYVLFYADKGFNLEKTPESVKGLALIYAGIGCKAGVALGVGVGAFITAVSAGTLAPATLLTGGAGCIIGAAVSGGRWFYTKAKFGYVSTITLAKGKDIEGVCSGKKS